MDLVLFTLLIVFIFAIPIGTALFGSALIGGLGSIFGAREQRRGMDAAAAAQERAAQIQKEIAETQLAFERERYNFQRGLIEAAQRGSAEDVALLRRALGFSPDGGFTLPEADLINASAAGRAMNENLRQNMLALSALRIDPATLATLIANAEMTRQMELSRMASEAQRQGAAQIAAFNTQRLMQLAGLGGAVQTPNVVGAMTPFAERVAEAGALRGQMAMQTGQNLLQGVGMLSQGIMQYAQQQAYLNQLAKMQQAASLPNYTVVAPQDVFKTHFLPTIAATWR